MFLGCPNPKNITLANRILSPNIPISIKQMRAWGRAHKRGHHDWEAEPHSVANPNRLVNITAVVKRHTVYIPAEGLSSRIFSQPSGKNAAGKSFFPNIRFDYRSLKCGRKTASNTSMSMSNLQSSREWVGSFQSSAVRA